MEIRDSEPAGKIDRRRRPVLNEPVIVDKFFKNRRKDVIVVSLKTYEGVNLIDVRQFVPNEAGQDRPTSKGVAIKVQRLPDLAAAINKAVRKAQELGLIDDQDEGGQ
jgi:hypothetical protein